MEHSRIKTGKALFPIAASFILICLLNLSPFWFMVHRLLGDNGFSLLSLAFPLLADILLPIGCILAYRNSGIGQFAVGGVCAVLLLAANLIYLPSSFHAPFFSNILSLFEALCLCLALWFSLKGTAQVLRVSNQIPLADKAHIFQMLAVIHAAICAVNFFFATIHVLLPIIIYYNLYITPIIFLSVAIYFAISAYQLVHVKEIDPKKIEEMRNRLQ